MSLSDSWSWWSWSWCWQTSGIISVNTLSVPADNLVHVECVHLPHIIASSSNQQTLVSLSFSCSSPLIIPSLPPLWDFMLWLEYGNQTNIFFIITHSKEVQRQSWERNKVSISWLRKDCGCSCVLPQLCYNHITIGLLPWSLSFQSNQTN